MESLASCAVPEQLRVERLLLDEYGITIHASMNSPAADYPVCGKLSRRIHGCYARTLADLPLGGVRVRVRVRKFFCDELSCSRKVFAERLKNVARVRARRTDRQRVVLERIAFALGGEAGARLAHELGLLVSPDALLNRIRGAFSANAGEVRALGVDDFAFKRGSAYGTILVDLERHKVVDLLPERSQESLAAWLKEHPGVEVATRDRSNVYARGISEGAPEATQVADRWHLLHGLALGLEDFLLLKRSALREAAVPESNADEERYSTADATQAAPSAVAAPSRRMYESVEGGPPGSGTSVSSSSGRR